MEKFKTLFVGTSEFAVPVLKKLTELSFVDLVGVVTQPDRPVGRHQSEFLPSKVKSFTKESDLDIPLFQPEKLRLESEAILEDTKPELIVVASYGQMIPELMLNYPKYKCINVHASLVPDLRGAVPMPMAILKGYDHTGVSILVMTKGLDDGDVLGQEIIELARDETTQSLTDKASRIGSNLLAEILPNWLAGKIKPKQQDHAKATFCYQSDISKTKAEIVHETDIELAERMIRAFYPWPVAWTYTKINGTDKRLKIYKAHVVSKENHAGKILKRDGNRLFIELANGTLELLEVQLEGKRRARASEYLFLAGK